MKVDEVELRPWRRSDAAALVRLLNDPAVGRWTTTVQPFGEKAARRWLAAQPMRWHTGSAASFAVVDRLDGGRVVGAVELLVHDWRHGVGETSSVVDPARRQRGLSTIATTLLVHWAFRTVGLERLESRVHVDNVPSRRGAEVGGWTQEGVLRSARVVQGERCDFVLYSRLRSESREEDVDRWLAHARATPIRSSSPSMRVESPPPS
jgi:RimJ/RimL family protein N-acetyltransferase